MDRTFGKLPLAPVPTIWITALAYVLVGTFFVTSQWLPDDRGYCERYSPLLFRSLTFHGALVLGCAIYVIRYRRRFGWLIPPLVILTITAALMLHNVQNGFPRLIDDMCWVAA